MLLAINVCHWSIVKINRWMSISQLTFTCSNLTIGAQEQGVKYVQS